MGNRTPREESSAKEQGTLAGYNEDPTLAGYVSSALMVLTVPTLLGLAYAGYRLGFYTYGGMVPAFGGLLIASIVLVFAAMHWLT